MQLTDKDWKAFRIEDLFIVDKGVYLKKNNILKGYNPYITATSLNNGISDFIGNQTLFSKNAITVEKISLSAYYQPHDFYCSHDVSIIQHKNLNKYTSLFITNMIKRQGIKYSYGRQAQMNVVKRETILLPIKNNNPDWDFMEKYTKKIFSKKEKLYIDHINGYVNNLVHEDILDLKDKEWKEFFIKDLFPSIQRGKRLTKANQINGSTPFVSSTSLNNGIDNYIDNSSDVRKFSNCLTIANSGSVGSSFYQPFEFVASDHVTHLKNNKMNKYVYLFIATLTNRLSEKYNFNREISDKRILREKVLLPVKDNNEPDYDYMEKYIKNIMKSKYNQYTIKIKKNKRSVE
ncbi:restriction endonuclease subunit S [Intestinibacter bartlettii]|uniref:restriction endonuclease subunit S n=1 Tax=Intestinibacter bartlettii TaxID=261299 RepID=UPI002903D93F|nr:restriction endonuclease subunit S [Intestinibacter bartlettii]MDU2163297.1 restriction endonuclease subunit S [Intestinibacter bartlettii]MDU4257567.1 restriction endonuclease subunit S [Intestinibacter bartlettii]